MPGKSLPTQLTQYALIVFSKKPEVIWFKTNSEASAINRAEEKARESDDLVQLHTHVEGRDIVVWSSVTEDDTLSEEELDDLWEDEEEDDEDLWEEPEEDEDDN